MPLFDRMESNIIITEDGAVQGCLRTNLDGEQFLSFLGIPYAKPPVGELRFKAPLPVDPWIGIRDATKDGHCCYQQNSSTGNIEGSEDCLNLNVFTKQVPKIKFSLKPVMVWIHGGAFRFGSNKSDATGPEFLMTEDIVLVTINYRLGFLGFLSLEDTSLQVPGNAGLKDQAMALKWVQKNISHFGGNPNNVTIFGESAGAVSVHFHVLSEHSEGLFHKAIIQSGVVLCPAAHAERHASEFVNFFKGIEVETEKEILDILKSMPVEALLRHQENFCEWRHYEDGLIGPVIEKPNDTEFITQPTMEIMTSGKYNRVPIMIGYCSNEGLLLEVGWRRSEKNGNSVPERKINVESFIPAEMDLKKDSTVRKHICEKLKDFYFEGKNANNIYLLPTDFFFVVGIIGCTKLHAKNSEVYLYRMSLDAGLNLLKRTAEINDLPGACHADDVGYLFKNTVDVGLTMGELEEMSVRRFVKLWTNFSKYGDPTPEGNDLNVKWSPVERETLHYLNIGDELTTHIDPESERMNVWKEIYQLSPITSDFL